MIRAVIFDCFGVIITDSLQVITNQLRAKDKLAAEEIDEIVRANNRGLLEPAESNRQIAAILGISVEEFRRRVLSGESKDQALLNYIAGLRPHYKTAMLSNLGASSLHSRFTDQELKRCFDAVVISGETGYAKPQAEAYQITAERLGVRPDECLFTDDRANFCDAARAAGMQAIPYQTFQQFQNDAKDFIDPHVSGATMSSMLTAEQFSISENNGIAALPQEALNVLSVGISTGGVAEMRMAELNKSRKVIATTVDEAGVAFAKELVNERGFSNQIEVKLEDVSETMPYANDSFDYIYARLVLHYLPKDKLQKALSEMYRVLKPGCKMFVVVRSVKCHDAVGEGAVYDDSTGLSTFTYENETGQTKSYTRFFHSEESISSYVKGVGFVVDYVKSYDEQLYEDFMRTKLSSHPDNLVELLVTKP